MILVTNDFYRVSAQQCMHNRLSILIKQLHPSVCPSAMFHGIVFKTAKLTHRHTSAYASQPSDNGGGSFSLDSGPFSGFENGVPSGCIGETYIFKIILIIDDVTLWLKLVEFTR